MAIQNQYRPQYRINTKSIQKQYRIKADKKNGGDSEKPPPRFPAFFRLVCYAAFLLSLLIASATFFATNLA